MKNDWNFTKGEWVAAIAVFFLIVTSYLVYYLYDNHKKPPLNLSGQDAVFVAFIARQQQIRDSITAAYNSPRNTGFESYHNACHRDTFPRKPKKLLYEIVKLDINRCDTDQIINIPQFGSKRAAKLVQYRQQLGGFYSLSQVREIYILQDVELDFLSKYFFVNQNDVQKININQIEYADLIRHPYFDAYLTKTILNYRKKHGNISTFDELQRITHAYPELMEKLKHYVSF